MSRSNLRVPLLCNLKSISEGGDEKVEKEVDTYRSTQIELYEQEGQVESRASSHNTHYRIFVFLLNCDAQKRE